MFPSGAGAEHGLRTAHELEAGLALVRFVDADCVLDRNRLDAATKAFEGDRAGTLRVVAGRLRERGPDAAIYGRPLDLERDTPLGEAVAAYRFAAGRARRGPRPARQDDHARGMTIMASGRRRAIVFGVEVDVVDGGEALARIVALAERRAAVAGRVGWRPAMILTPNLDHAVRLRRDAAFRAAYGAADLVLADGFPLVWASRLGGGPRLPERVAGSDLVVPVCGEAARRGWSVFVLGTTIDVLSIACRHLRARHPALVIAGAYAPGLGFSAAHPDSDEALAAINAARPDLLFVALGSPRQEVWTHACLERLDAGAVLCVGAAFDFLAGRPPRAPRLVRRLCLEWLWRLLGDPRRYGRRYARNFAWLPLLAAAQLRQGLAAGRRR